MPDTKYIAYKLKNLDHWLWFEQINIDRDETRIIARKGWLGHDRSLVERMDIDPKLIEGTVESETLGIEGDI